MSSEVVRYQVDDKTVAQFEFEPPAGFQPAGLGDIAGWVREAAAPSIEAARAVLDQVQQLAPDSVQVKFGIKVTGTANWIVAKAASEANFEITLSWQPESGAHPGPLAGG
ncbi:CU044_2847 family protein [Paractinoplanes deccanensis]|uniref:CU044_2847 family protein n=1 Tax=Paractinoplanes deccanensis TaxID=113561 RepID=UPI0019423F91|nr:CU044_2847 family protein [Actinoplanes deccanensis]